METYGASVITYNTCMILEMLGQTGELVEVNHSKWRHEVINANLLKVAKILSGMKKG